MPGCLTRLRTEALETGYSGDGDSGAFGGEPRSTSQPHTMIHLRRHSPSRRPAPGVEKRGLDNPAPSWYSASMGGRQLWMVLVDEVRHEATATWRTSWRIAGAVFYGTIVGGVLVAVSVAHRPTFRFVTREDSVLEWPQFLAFATAAVFAALAAARLYPGRRLLLAVFFALMGVSCLFIAGEEISWGQRILGFETSETWREINKQDETTLHNVEGVLVIFNGAMLLISTIAVVASLVFLRRRPAGLLGWLVPPSYMVPAFATMMVYKTVRFTILPESSFTVVKLGEWAELCLAVALAVFAVESWRRSQREIDAGRSQLHELQTEE